MTHHGNVPARYDLAYLGLALVGNAFLNLNAAELIQETIALRMGVLSNTGALAIQTGEFTGRSPKDRYIVKDHITEHVVWWGEINIPFDAARFDRLYERMCAYLKGRDIYIKDAAVCDHPDHNLKVRVITELPWSNLFIDNMFLRLTPDEHKYYEPEWTLVCAPGFMSDPEIDGTRQHNFAILNFSKKMAIVGGTGYTGEMKKGIFSALNFILPHMKGVLPMHCSANLGKAGDTAIFFGLSGTGKTTLSSDPDRRLIGDDEHGWTDDGIFNFEGGCYAKCINLTEVHEPQIFNAIKFGALLENTRFKAGSNEVNFTDGSITENTRVSYPIHHIENVVQPSRGDSPENIFFLTADAFGVLPPISKLTPEQASYYFISGYTAKVAGTEEGIKEPQTVFSACFGAPFMPLHPGVYAEMLAERIRKHRSSVWLINTGWSGGPYGIGSRIKLKYTRAMISAALEGKLDEVAYISHDVFGLQIPQTCPDVPDHILKPRETWADKSAYDYKALELAQKFVDNFRKFENGVSDAVMSASPKIGVQS